VTTPPESEKLTSLGLRAETAMHTADLVEDDAPRRETPVKEVRLSGGGEIGAKGSASAGVRPSELDGASPSALQESAVHDIHHFNVWMCVERELRACLNLESDPLKGPTIAPPGLDELLQLSLGNKAGCVNHPLCQNIDGWSAHCFIPARASPATSFALRANGEC